MVAVAGDEALRRLAVLVVERHVDELHRQPTLAGVERRPRGENRRATELVEVHLRVRLLACTDDFW